MSFGEKLTKLRKEKGMSQEDLANNLNVSRQAVSKWESNNSYPETEKIVAICKLFNCSMDELIGLKDAKERSDNKILTILNKYFDKFVKGIKLFYNMTFTQKIKCIFEMGFYLLFLFLIFIVLDIILVEIIRKLLYLLPDEILIIMIQTFEGVFYIIYVIFTVYVLVKLYKIRYLDYYENYLIKKEKNNEDKNIEVVENKKEKVNIKEEKIIIRDLNNNFKPFSLLKKTINFLIKMLALILSFCLAASFVIIIAIMIFTLNFVNCGLLIMYTTLGLFGILIGLYVIIEILIKFIFNMEQKPKRLFIMFIIAMIIVGVSSGLFGSELSTFKIIDNDEYEYKILEERIEMQDNLIINYINDYNVDIVLENRSDVLVEFYSKNTMLEIDSIHDLEHSMYIKNNLVVMNKVYDVYYYTNIYYRNVSFNEILRIILESIKNKEIINDDYSINIKIHLNDENYKKLLDNHNNKYYDYIYCE